MIVSFCPVRLGTVTQTEETEMEDVAAAARLAEREEELRVGARALTRRLKVLEKRAIELRTMPTPEEVDHLDEEVAAARWGLYELTANAIGGDYIAADVALWCDRAQEMGAGHPRLDLELLLDLIHVRKVPNAPFRAALARLLRLPLGFVGQENTREARILLKTYNALRAAEDARGENYGAASLVASQGPQTRVLRRWLGIETYPNPAPRLPGLRLFVSYEQAEALAFALNLSPHQAGI
jgi:hypothetical protein